jgi:hypothetical protein
MKNTLTTDLLADSLNGPSRWGGDYVRETLTGVVGTAVLPTSSEH